MSPWVDNTRLFFSEDVFEIRQAKARKKTAQKTTWPSTMLNCLARQHVSHSASTMVRQHWVSSSNQTLCQPNSTWSCTSTSSLNLMNDNKCSTRLYFGLTMEECQQLWKAKVSNITFSWEKATGFNWLAMWPSRIAINNWLITRRTKITLTRRRTTPGFGFQHLIVLCHYQFGSASTSSWTTRWPLNRHPTVPISCEIPTRGSWPHVEQQLWLKSTLLRFATEVKLQAYAVALQQLDQQRFWLNRSKLNMIVETTSLVDNSCCTADSTVTFVLAVWYNRVPNWGAVLEFNRSLPQHCDQGLEP